MSVLIGCAGPQFDGIHIMYLGLVCFAVDEGGRDCGGLDKWIWGESWCEVSRLQAGVFVGGEL